MVVNEALKFLLFSVAENPGLLLRIAQRGVIEWFTGLKAAAPDRELYRCEGGVLLAAHARASRSTAECRGCPRCWWCFRTRDERVQEGGRDS